MSETQVNQVVNAVEEIAFTNESRPAVVVVPPPKNQVIVPPTWFNLVEISNYDMLSHISYLTRRFSDLPPDLANWIIYDANTRPYSFYGTIPAPPVADLVKKIIGVNGYYLKLTTQYSLVDFIWHDRVRNEFQFWGEYHSCVKAMNEIRYRICKYVEMYKIAPVPAPAPAPEPAPVFYNDIHPNPAVCLEAIINLDENGEYKNTVASKYYPDAN